MATPLATAFVRIRPDTKTFGKETEAGIAKAGRDIQSGGRRQGRLFGTTFARASAGGLKSSAGVFTKTLGGIATGFAAVAAVDFGRDSVKAFTEAESAQAKLADAFNRFPKLANINIETLRRYNQQLATKTRFDDDAIASGQAVLASFGLTGQQLRNVTPLIADYAAKTGKDFPTAARLLGKASLGNTRALKDLGINYKSTGNRSKDFANISALLAQKVGGFAEKEGKTAAGQAAILSNQFGELQESIGQKLLPVISVLVSFLIKNLIPGFAALGKLIADNKELFIALGIGIAAVLVPAFLTWAAAATAAAVATIAANAPLILIGAVIAGLAFLIIKNWDKIKAVTVAVWHVILGAIQAVWNWIKKNWPLLLAILLGPIAIAVTLIAKNWDKIKAGASAVHRWIVDRFNAVLSFFKGLPGKIARVASGMWDGISNAFRGAINFIISAWNRLEFRIPGFDPPGPGPKFSGFTLGVPDIPLLAQGGIVRHRPGGILAVLGEGPSDELGAPVRRAGVKAVAGGGTTVNYNITVQVAPTANRHEIGREIVGAIKAFESGSGKAWRR